MQAGSSLLLEDRRRRETRSLPGTLARLVCGAYYLTVSDIWCLMRVSQCYWTTSTTDGGLPNDERLKPAWRVMPRGVKARRRSLEGGRSTMLAGVPGKRVQWPGLVMLSETGPDRIAGKNAAQCARRWAGEDDGDGDDGTVDAYAGAATRAVKTVASREWCAQQGSLEVGQGRVRMRSMSGAQVGVWLRAMRIQCWIAVAHIHPYPPPGSPQKHNHRPQARLSPYSILTSRTLRAP